MHRNARLVDIVDEEWRADKLLNDRKIEVKPEHDIPIDDIDGINLICWM